jgi:membrane-anchored protein YejM (alkaline phosphatase superfamily)
MVLKKVFCMVNIFPERQLYEKTQKKNREVESKLKLLQKEVENCQELTEELKDATKTSLQLRKDNAKLLKKVEILSSEQKKKDEICIEEDLLLKVYNSYVAATKRVDQKIASVLQNLGEKIQ